DSTTCNGAAPCDLDFEIETYDGSAGKLVAWVRVPKVYAGDSDPDNDSVIYMYYGNGCVADDPQNATAVWDSNYKSVLHLAEKYGLDFDGATSYVDSGYNTHHTQTTIEVWIYPQGWGENTMGRVVDKREAEAQVFTLYLYGFSPGKHLRFERVHDGNTGSWRTNDDTIVLDTWQHIVVTYDESDPANDPSIYLNGQLQSLTEMETPSGNPLTNTDDYIIGNRGAGDRTFDGIIDNLRIYSRILTSAEINDRYLGKREPSREGLVIEYLMDEGSGNTVSDSSGNGLDGDMTGHAAAWIRPRAHDSTANSNFGKRSTSMAAPVERINGCDPFDNQGVGIPDPGGSWEFADGGLDAGTSDFTISAWYYWSSSMTQQYPTIVYNGGGGPAEAGYWFNFDKVTNGIDVRVSNGTERFVANSNTPLGMNAGEWNYVTARTPSSATSMKCASPVSCGQPIGLRPNSTTRPLHPPFTVWAVKRLPAAMLLPLLQRRYTATTPAPRAVPLIPAASLTPRQHSAPFTMIPIQEISPTSTAWR
ncbi:MAG: LamG-like jellyroll fold domain-containing protein, partial [Planctomycetota bacterium]